MRVLSRMPGISSSGSVVELSSVSASISAGTASQPRYCLPPIALS
jgi:hypothetical protein